MNGIAVTSACVREGGQRALCTRDKHAEIALGDDEGRGRRVCVCVCVCGGGGEVRGGDKRSQVNGTEHGSAGTQTHRLDRRNDSRQEIWSN